MTKRAYSAATQVKGQQIPRPGIETLRKDRPCDRLGEDEDFDIATLQNSGGKSSLAPLTLSLF